MQLIRFYQHHQQVVLTLGVAWCGKLYVGFGCAPTGPCGHIFSLHHSLNIGFADAFTQCHINSRKDHFKQSWTVSDQCPGTVHVTICDKWGQNLLWIGRAGDTFYIKDAMPV